jgi:hypothetical protein
MGEEFREEKKYGEECDTMELGRRREEEEEEETNRSKPYLMYSCQ